MARHERKVVAMVPDPVVIPLSRMGHDYAAPGLRSCVTVEGRSDSEGGTVELVLDLWTSSVSKDRDRRPRPVSRPSRIVIPLSVHEARELGEAIRDAGSVVDYDEAAPLAPVVPMLIERTCEERREWSGPCSPACSFGHAKAGE